MPNSPCRCRYVVATMSPGPGHCFYVLETDLSVLIVLEKMDPGQCRRLKAEVELWGCPTEERAPD